MLMSIYLFFFFQSMVGLAMTHQAVRCKNTLSQSVSGWNKSNNLKPDFWVDLHTLPTPWVQWDQSWNQVSIWTRFWIVHQLKTSHVSYYIQTLDLTVLDFTSPWESWKVLRCSEMMRMNFYNTKTWTYIWNHYTIWLYPELLYNGTNWESVFNELLCQRSHWSAGNGQY